MKELNGYQEWESILALSFGEMRKKGEIIPVAKELENPEILREYRNWAKKIKKLKPLEYKENDFNRLNNDDELNSLCIIETAVLILVDLLGEEVIPHFNNFISLIEVTNDESVLNGVVIEDGMLKQIRKVNIPNLTVEAHIASIVHEFMHYYQKVKKVEDNKNVSYLEILSQFGEKYAVKKIVEKSADEEVEKKLYSTRLESIKYHFVDGPNEINKTIDMYKQTIKNKNISLEQKKIFKDNVRNLFPWLTSPEGIQDFKDYKTSLRDSYTIGYLYSDALLEKMLIDENSVKESLNKYFDGEVLLEDILKEQNISLENFELFEKSFEKAAKILSK